MQMIYSLDKNAKGYGSSFTIMYMYDLAISTETTEYVHQPAPGKPTITINGQKLKGVDKFTFPGNALSRAVHTDDEITVRNAKASVAFERLHANV